MAVIFHFPIPHKKWLTLIFYLKYVGRKVTYSHLRNGSLKKIARMIKIM